MDDDGTSRPAAVVTGAASGIGLAVAEALRARRHEVCMVDVAGGPLESHAARLGASAEVVDVTDPVAMNGLAARMPHARLILLNAGIVGAAPGAPWEVSADEWDRVFAVNVAGVVNGLRAFVPALLAADEPAHVVITGSLAGLLTFPGGGAYGPSKHAVTAIASHAAMALADSPVRIHLICPALVATGMSPDGEDPHIVAGRVLRAIEGGVFAVVDDEWGDAILDRARRLISGRHPRPPRRGEPRRRSPGFKPSP